MCETIKNDQDEDEQFNELWATFHFLKITLKNYISLDTDTTSTGTDVSIRFEGDNISNRSTVRSSRV